MDTLELLKDVVILLLSLGALHYISEKYFIPSLDHLSKRLRLSTDMAGSTLMAAGSSAPELAVALFAIFKSGGNHADLGIGTIVGSALFNILVISGVVMLIRKPARLIWQPIFRDILFYVLAIILLATVYLSGYFGLLSGLLLVGAYVAYILVVYYWKRVFPYSDIEGHDEVADIKHYRNFIFEGLNRLSMRILRFYIPAFLFSIGMVTLLSWLLVESAIGISASLGVPELLIGLTVVAIGTSVPDLIASVIVARQGRPGMAINNAIGSNVFDILIGLGLPLLLYFVFLPGHIPAESGNLAWSVGILFASALLLMIFFVAGKWRTSRVFGFFFIGLYAIYLVYIVYASV
jgi:K+-dependent Na+/Ca+ exchanger-like protein